MKKILQSLGMGGGKGDVSSTRIIALLFALGYIVAKFYNAHTTQALVSFDSSDIGIIATIAGIPILKGVVEDKADKNATPPEVKK